MKRLNVRCCCQPTKVLGTLPVHQTSIDHRTFTVRMLDNWPSPSYRPLHEAPTRSRVERIEIREFQDGDRHELAIYSEERPVEFWRRFPDFKQDDSV